MEQLAQRDAQDQGTTHSYNPEYEAQRPAGLFYFQNISGGVLANQGVEIVMPEPVVDPLIDDPDDDDDEGQNKTIKEVRAAERRARRELADAKRQLDEANTKLAEKETKDRMAGLARTAEEIGLEQSQFDLLVSLKPDLEPDGLKTLAGAFGVKPGEPEETRKPEQPFKPQAGGNPSTKVYGDEDIKEAVRTRDSGAIRRIAEEAVKDRSRLKLKWEHLIEK